MTVDWLIGFMRYRQFFSHVRWFLINEAQIQYLQDEYASILVKSQFDTTRSKLFRALQKDTSARNVALWKRYA